MLPAILAYNIQKLFSISFVFHGTDTMNIQKTICGLGKTGGHFNQGFVRKNYIGRELGLVGNGFAPLA